MDNKNIFEIWLNEQRLSKITVNNYLRGIRYVEEKFSHIIENKGNLNIYEITDVSKINEILNNNDFQSYDKLGNRMSSSGLKKYKEFLETANENEGNPSTFNNHNKDTTDIINIEDVVLIKITQSYHNDISPEELYKVTSVSWKVSLKKTSTRNIKFYCPVYNNVIKEVFELTGYSPDRLEEKKGRYILEGKIANNEIRDQLISLNVSSIHNGKGNPIKYTSLERLLNLDPDSNENFEEEEASPQDFSGLTTIELLSHIHSYIKTQGFYYSEEDLHNFYLSLRSKPFVIISGISGTGKTKIVELFANSVGATEDNGRFKMIPVRPDWSDSSDLLGYLTLQEAYKKGPLAELVEHAMNYPNLPHFALLDEMNLARVEYYFSGILSVMESRKIDMDGRATSSYLIDPNLYQKEAFGESEAGPLRLTNNIYIIGTVNMDETTHPFSKKVLDRANTIEFNRIELNHFDFLTGLGVKEPAKLISNDNLEAKYIQLIDVFSTHRKLIEKISMHIEEINRHLSKINAQVGYRVRDEICFYMIHNSDAGLLKENEALDFCYMQKILPRISGGQVVGEVLQGLKELWTEQTEEGQIHAYPKSFAKVEEMIGRLGDNGFTSFWIA